MGEELWRRGLILDVLRRDTFYPRTQKPPEGSPSTNKKKATTDPPWQYSTRPPAFHSTRSQIFFIIAPPYFKKTCRPIVPPPSTPNLGGVDPQPEPLEKKTAKNYMTHKNNVLKQSPAPPPPRNMWRRLEAWWIKTPPKQDIISTSNFLHLEKRKKS